MKQVYCMMGPTGSGKTAHVLALAAHLPIEVISVDSTLVYRGLDIGSAKPTVSELAICPHHLIDIRDPVETYSVASFMEDAHRCIAQILARGRIPVLVGGTMLYFRALQQGLSPLPPADEKIRAEIAAWAASEGWAAIHSALQQVDPIAAARIRPQDPQRLSRAMEVYRMTGQPLSTLQGVKDGGLPYAWVNIAFMPNRPWLHARIEARFKQMLDMGLIEEVRHLIARWPDIVKAPALRAVGYRQVVMYLQGVYTDAELLKKGVEATRQLAKRQCTWLKTWPAVNYFDPEPPSSMTALLAYFQKASE